MAENFKAILLPEEVVDSSPSRREGIPEDVEKRYRAFGCSLIQEAAVLLHLPQVVAATAQTLLHRFYFRKSLRKYDVFHIASACMFLSAKIEEQPVRPIRHVINVFHHIRQLRRGVRRPKPLQLGGDHYNRRRKKLFYLERYILQQLGYGLYNIMQHPHKFIIYFTKALHCSDSFRQVAWNYMNDSLRLDLCVRFEPHVIACAAIMLAAREKQVVLPDNPSWCEAFDTDKATVMQVASEIYALYGSEQQILTKGWCRSLRLYVAARPDDAFPTTESPGDSADAETGMGVMSGGLGDTGADMLALGKAMSWGDENGAQAGGEESTKGRGHGRESVEGATGGVEGGVGGGMGHGGSGGEGSGDTEMQDTSAPQTDGPDAPPDAGREGDISDSSEGVFTDESDYESDAGQGLAAVGAVDASQQDAAPVVAAAAGEGAASQTVSESVPSEPATMAVVVPVAADVPAKSLSPSKSVGGDSVVAASGGEHDRTSRRSHSSSRPRYQPDSRSHSRDRSVPRDADAVMAAASSGMVESKPVLEVSRDHNEHRHDRDSSARRERRRDERDYRRDDRRRYSHSHSRSRSRSPGRNRSDRRYERRDRDYDRQRDYDSRRSRGYDRYRSGRR